MVAWGQCTPGMRRALGLGTPILLAQLVEELKDLTEPLEVQSGEIECALSH